jgi:2-phospho-L-lactate/phosphoenolpyruvate guanylyltransferase
VTTYAILPVKRFERAKQRLGGALSDGSRWALAEAMVTDVLVALRRAKRVDAVLVVTCEPRAESIAIGWGADVVADPQERSHSDAATIGIREAVERGATRVLLVPGDCPSLDAREVDELLAAGAGVVVVPDRHGTGTNALVLDPPGAIAPGFGPGSCERHVDRAHEADVHVEIQHTPSLMLDVDTGEDLEALQDALAASTGGAAHTRGMLARLGRL